MKDKKNEILSGEIGKAGALGGVTGSLGGIVGGALGANTVANLLPNICEANLEINASLENLMSTAYDLLVQLGKVVENVEPPSDLPTIYGLMGSGFFNLNPTIVKIQVISIVGNKLAISIRGTAKEGLIKQRAGEKAVKRLIELINESFFIKENIPADSKE